MLYKNWKYWMEAKVVSSKSLTCRPWPMLTGSWARVTPTTTTTTTLTPGRTPGLRTLRRLQGDLSRGTILQKNKRLFLKFCVLAKAIALISIVDKRELFHTVFGAITHSGSSGPLHKDTMKTEIIYWKTIYQVSSAFCFIQLAWLHWQDQNTDQTRFL